MHQAVIRAMKRNEGGKELRGDLEVSQKEAESGMTLGWIFACLPSSFSALKAQASLQELPTPSGI